MSVALGALVYAENHTTVPTKGYKYDQSDLDAARNGLVKKILDDEKGLFDVAELCNSLELTEFGKTNVAETLKPIPEQEYSKGWREGEALAEAWLITHKSCEFPWPFNRDMRHHKASLPGAELVGFTGAAPDDYRLAFGQVKTSYDSAVPPSVVKSGDKNLVKQGLELRDDEKIKATLFKYLTTRAVSNPTWAPKFKAAAVRYLNSGMLEYVIFGVIVRDVDHNAHDLHGAATKLAENCPALTRIELYGIYLPNNSIPRDTTTKPKAPKAPEPPKAAKSTPANKAKRGDS
jgi:hypothetical protein